MKNLNGFMTSPPRPGECFCIGDKAPGFCPGALFFKKGGEGMPSKANIQELQKLIETLQGAQAVFFSEYKGLTVEQIGELRSKVREAKGIMRVAKNTLFGLALKEVGLSVPEEVLSGPNVFTVAYGDPVEVAKVLANYVKATRGEALKLKGALLDKRFIDAGEVNTLATLPTRDILLAQVFSAMEAPIRGLVTVLSGTVRGLVTCLDQIAKEKEKQAA